MYRPAPEGFITSPPHSVSIPRMAVATVLASLASSGMGDLRSVPRTITRRREEEDALEETGPARPSSPGRGLSAGPTRGRGREPARRVLGGRLEAPGGFEPPNTGFADPGLTTWRRCRSGSVVS